jgi:hypothetical protein
LDRPQVRRKLDLGARRSRVRGVSLVEMGPPDPNIPTVGSGGGYGGIYCFALSP